MLIVFKDVIYLNVNVKRSRCGDLNFKFGLFR